MNQAQQRQHILAKRRRYPRIKRHLDSVRIGVRLNRAAPLSERIIASYIGTDDEVNTRTINRQLSRLKARVYVPYVLPDMTMAFVPLAPFSHYKYNRYGIGEPRYNSVRKIPTNRLDYWLVPLVGFDKQCHRIGMGGGYYDRVLAHINTTKKTLFGLAFRFQQCRRIAPSPWDTPLNAVVCPALSWHRSRQK